MPRFVASPVVLALAMAAAGCGRGKSPDGASNDGAGQDGADHDDAGHDGTGNDADAAYDAGGGDLSRDAANESEAGGPIACHFPSPHGIGCAAIYADQLASSVCSCGSGTSCPTRGGACGAFYVWVTMIGYDELRCVYDGQGMLVYASRCTDDPGYCDHTSYCQSGGLDADPSPGACALPYIGEPGCAPDGGPLDGASSGDGGP